MREPVVPERPDDPKPVIDGRVGKRRALVRLVGSLEEGHQQEVLTLRLDFDEPAGFDAAHLGLTHHAQHVVLVFDETSHRLEGDLVLELAIKDRAHPLVPAVGSQVLVGVELAEQCLPMAVLRPTHLHSKRRGSPRRLFAEGLERRELEAGLFLERLADRLRAPIVDREVRGSPTLVADRVDLVRAGDPERDHGRGDAGDRPEHLVARMIHAEVDARDREECDRHRDADHRARPPTTRRDERVGRAHEGDRECGDLG